MTDLRPVNQLMQAIAYLVTDVDNIQADISSYSCKGEFDFKTAFFQPTISGEVSSKQAVRGEDRILLPKRLLMKPRTLDLK